MTPPVLNLLTSQFAEIAPHRPRQLFTEFLPQGYAMTTLDTVPEELRAHAIAAKLAIGMIITLYDDFADRPLSYNPKLLSLLYQMPLGMKTVTVAMSVEEQATIRFARKLHTLLEQHLAPLPQAVSFKKLFMFDLQQFFAANMYSELMMQFPDAHNELENRLYLHHNMGMIMAGMIDLMALPRLPPRELSRARMLFLLGQRYGRICNVLATEVRERHEGDVTNEIVASQMNGGGGSAEQLVCRLVREKMRLLHRMEKLQPMITSFSVRKYMQGLIQLGRLHEQFTGTI